MKSLLGTDRKMVVRRLARIEYLTACAVYLTPSQRGDEITAIATLLHKSKHQHKLPHCQ